MRLGEVLRASSVAGWLGRWDEVKVVVGEELVMAGGVRGLRCIWERGEREVWGMGTVGILRGACV